MDTGWQQPSSPSWVLLDEEYRPVWDRFYKQFAFSPSVYPKDWPVFSEPIPSITYDIGQLWDPYHKGGIVDEVKIANLWRDMDANALSAFRKCVSPGTSMYALDWQHPSYRFFPHLASLDERRGVDVIPNGDYYIFIAEDFSFGTFGHPWEPSICVFGQVLLDAFDNFRPLLFNRVLRRNGEYVAPTR